MAIPADCLTDLESPPTAKYDWLFVLVSDADDAEQVVDSVRRRYGPAPLVVIWKGAPGSKALESLGDSADDVLTTPVSSVEIRLALGRARRCHRLADELRRVVGELQSVLERVTVAGHADGAAPSRATLDGARPLAGRGPDLRRPLPELLREATTNLEKSYLLRALKKTRGNIGRCARLCGLSRRSISAKLAEYQIDKRPFKYADG